MKELLIVGFFISFGLIVAGTVFVVGLTIINIIENRGGSSK